jgi:hypothetical protein
VTRGEGVEIGSKPDTNVEVPQGLPPQITKGCIPAASLGSDHFDSTHSGQRLNTEETPLVPVNKKPLPPGDGPLPISMTSFRIGLIKYRLNLPFKYNL